MGGFVKVIFLLGLLSGSASAKLAKIWLDGKEMSSLQSAFNNAVDGSVVKLGPGELVTSGVISANHITIEGSEGTKLHSHAAEGKAAIVVKGRNTLIKNIECYNIEVRDGNGACVRLEGKYLILDGVFFHNSQQGLLTAGEPEQVLILNSRFEKLGKAGQAHGIYVGGGELVIEGSAFLSSKDEGHEIKTRARKTTIRNTVIASLNEKDSRLIDVSNGGVLEIFDSVLQQGPNTSNWNLIGYGLEGYKYETNKITMLRNVFLLEREMGNLVLKVKGSEVDVVSENNVFIGTLIAPVTGDNLFFDDRTSAGLKAFPYLPLLDKLNL